MTINQLISFIGLATFATASFAEKDQYIDYARVTQVTPIYETVENRIPEERCWVERVQEEQPHRRYDSKTGTIAGAIIGGAIGHSVGHGHDNKRIGTVVGSIIGASIGKDISHRHNYHHNHGSQTVAYRDVERCETDYRTERAQELVAYDVTYQYAGRIYHAEMNEDPGKRMKVSVQVAPLHF